MTYAEHLRDLHRSVSEWSALAGFSIESHGDGTEPDEPWLTIHSAAGRVTFEPASFAADRSPTVIRVYAFPTLRQVQLVGPIAGAWEFRSTQGIPFRVKWNQTGFGLMMSDLLQ
ncbi:MAG: hypothetical protein SFX74_03180 [Fimbriimonadaceae bacterium]|nr:hypothetical protein [Fimbriimonadaceae bacterium]